MARPKPKKVQRIESLSPRAQSAIKARRVVGSNPFQYWVDLLTELAAYDDITDQLYAKARTKFIWFIVLSVLALIGSVFGVIAAVSNRNEEYVLPILLIGGPALIALVVLSAVFGKKAGALGNENLANDFRLSLIPLLDELSEDVREKSPVKVDIDFKGVTGEKIKSKQQVPPGRFKKVEETVYVDPWCKMILTLEDRSAVVLLIENTFIEQKRSYTSSSGKYKTKTKWKKLVEVTAALDPGSDELAFDQSQIDSRAIEEKLKIKEKQGQQICRLTRKFKFTNISSAPEMAVKPSEIIGMLMELFSLLKPAAKGA